MKVYRLLPNYEIVQMPAFSDMETRPIARTDLGHGKYVSTVFLSLDHNYGDDGPPLLFETMVVLNDRSGYMERSSTYQQAMEIHERVVNTERRSSTYQQAMRMHERVVNTERRLANIIDDRFSPALATKPYRKIRID